jgi:phosphatidylglycerophosphatase C
MYPNPENVLAVFDLDGTLVRGDCFLPFMVSYARARRKYRALLTLPLHVGMYAARLTRDHVAKERVMVAVLRGESRALVAEHATKFCESWVRPRLRETVVARLREHQAAGHRVVLLSASPDVYVEPIARMLGIEEVVCTRVRSADEVWDGRLDGGNCKGEGKVAALRTYLSMDYWPSKSYGYGDSKSDLPILAWVTTGYLVSRRGEFARHSSDL